jgi:hypothetical protein
MGLPERLLFKSTIKRTKLRYIHQPLSRTYEELENEIINSSEF